MAIVKFNANNTKVHVWVRTRSGATVTMVFPDSRFTFDGNWKEIDLTTQQLVWVKRQNRLVEVSEVNPNEKEEKPKVSLQAIKLNKSNITMVVGDNTSVGIEYVPSDVDKSTLNPEALSDKLRVASVSLKGTTISIVAHAVGTTIVRVVLGTMTATCNVSVVATPAFSKKEYTGLVGEEITLACNCASAVTLTVPENVSVVEGNKVIAEKPGTYEIIASAYGKTFTTKLVVSEPTETTTE